MSYLSFRCSLIVIGGLLGGLLAGCAEQSEKILDEPNYKWVKSVAADLDPVAKGLDEYGTISMSCPMLAEPDASFAFDLKNSSHDYYADARKDINGASASSNQQSSVTSAGTTVQLDVQKLVQEAIAASTGGAGSLLSAAAGPTTLPAINVNVLPTTQSATSALSSDKFTAAMALLNGTAPVLENRAAIITAAGDSATQAMLNFLVSPQLATKFKDKKILLGVSMVSVRPGSKTSTGFDASVAQTFLFEYRPVTEAMRRRLANDPMLREKLEEAAIDADAFKNSGPKTPLVAAVSPMTETQTLDLQSSVRKQRQNALKIATALAGFGAGVQAQAFNDWVNRLESDVSTVSPMNVVTSFGHGANICGFSVTPRLRAQLNPANQSQASEAAMVLDPVSFPTLVLLGIDVDDLRLVAVRSAPGMTPLELPRDAKLAPAEQAGTRFAFYAPILKTYQLTHWTPLVNPANKRMEGEPLTETRRLAWASHIERAMATLRCHLDPTCRTMVDGGNLDTHRTDPIPDYLNQEIYTLGCQAVHCFSTQLLPEKLLLEASGAAEPAAIPQITEMVAADIQTDAAGKANPQPAWIIGTGFDSVQLDKITPVLPVGGDAANLPTLTVANPSLIGKGVKKGSSQAIRFDVSAVGGKGHVPVAFQLSYTAEDGTPLVLLTPPIDVHSKDLTPPKSVTLTRTSKKSDGTQSDEVTFPSDAPAGPLQSFLALPTTRPAPISGEVDVNVRARSLKQ